MSKRTEIPGTRKLAVKWSTEEWTPAITASQMMPRQARAQLLLDFPLRQPSPRKRKLEVILWVRGAGRMVANGVTGRNGSRTTWR